MQERYNFCEWDEETFKLPDEYLLDENSDLAEALNVFYSAGGYDFFNAMGLFFCYLFRPTCPIYCGLESVRARLVMGHVDYDGLFSTVRST